MCEERLLENSDVDDLLKEYELQKREVYINRTIPGIDRLESIAYRLADAYEMEYRANPTYENEERMRYWRYMGAKHWSSKADGTYYEGPNTECILRKKEYDEMVRQHTETSQHVDQKHHKKKRTLTNDELEAFIFIGLTGSIIATPIIAMIFLYLLVGPAH